MTLAEQVRLLDQRDEARRERDAAIAARDAALSAAKSARWHAVYGPMVAIELSKHEPPTVPILEATMRYAVCIADQAEEAWEKGEGR